jgi:hypothetical protein
VRNGWSRRALYSSVLTVWTVVLVIFSEAARADCADATCQNSFIAAHNAVRTKVNIGLEPGPGGTLQSKPGPALGALTWGTGFATAVQSYANSCVFNHSGAALRPGRGENIYFSGPAGQSPGTPTGAVAAWDAESVEYTYGVLVAGDPNFGKFGHYTQLVWADTTQVACGVQTCGNVTTTVPGLPPDLGPGVIVVCQYSPAGNFIGKAPYSINPVVPAIPAGALDVDGNGQYDALTDGVIILRYLFGLTGAPLVSNALAANASITLPATIMANLTQLRPQLDVDGNGQVDALTDGLLILRHLFGLRGAQLVNGAVGANPTRGTAALIEPYIQALRP